MNYYGMYVCPKSQEIKFISTMSEDIIEQYKLKALPTDSIKVFQDIIEELDDKTLQAVIFAKNKYYAINYDNELQEMTYDGVNLTRQREEECDENDEEFALVDNFPLRYEIPLEGFVTEWDSLPEDISNARESERHYIYELLRETPYLTYKGYVVLLTRNALREFQPIMGDASISMLEAAIKDKKYKVNYSYPSEVRGILNIGEFITMDRNLLISHNSMLEAVEATGKYEYEVNRYKKANGID